MRPLLGRLADVLSPVGLAQPAFRLYERAQSLAGRNTGDLPPPYLRVLTAGTADPDAFRELGERAAQEIVELAERFRPELGARDQVLEFGCGCGRVARPLLQRRPVRLSGCDINGELIAWCRANLPGRFELTGRAPPLPYPQGTFDMVYALSVFTHLGAESSGSWLEELARVTRPGGLAVLTFLDETSPAAASFRPRLLEQGFFLKRGGEEGSNLFTGFFTHQAFASHAAPFWRRLDSVTCVDSAQGQAVMVLERA